MTRSPTHEASLDLETFGVSNNAVVVSIGACSYSRYELETYDDIRSDSERCFYMTFPLIEQGNRDYSPNTIKWWLQQSEAARMAVVEESIAKTDSQVLIAFYDWCSDQGIQRIWGNGSTFDNIILRSLCKDLGIPYPVSFRHDRDLRTLVDVSDGVEFRTERKGEAHNALDDAINQAVWAQHMFNALRTDPYEEEIQL